MYDRVTCTCGKSLSYVMPIFEQAYNMKKKIIGTDQLVSHMHGSIPLTSITVGEILDQLQIYNVCCRTKMLTNITWASFIGMPYSDIKESK